MLYADSTEALAGCREAAATFHRLARDNVTAYVVTRTQATAQAGGGQTDADGRHLPVFQDGAAQFERLYGVEGPTALLIPPDGYLSARLSPLTTEGTVSALSDALGRLFRL
ncbi:hypothetical protein [Streptomyces shaanxiensis]|uniref:Redoxin domain-containing protein n=1 Tax=Streptomyces shaanxiensis TaxID=653357 RepID=A0ABP7VRG1_9ACTN